jgi:hypothetical protein
MSPPSETRRTTRRHIPEDATVLTADMLTELRIDGRNFLIFSKYYLLGHY